MYILTYQGQTKIIAKFLILFRVGSKMNNWKLYPGALMEMARVTRVEKGRACLLTQDKKCINKVGFVVIFHKKNF